MTKSYGSIEKLISGGQTGVDSAIIKVNQHLGIAIGGVVPKGWKTEAGPRPDLELWGFVEAESDKYPVRTRLNVEEADATLIFATNDRSPGTEQTVNFAVAARKPHLVVNPFAGDAVAAIEQWLREYEPRVLNVAGNRESVSPGIHAQTVVVLEAVLGRLSEP